MSATMTRRFRVDPAYAEAIAWRAVLRREAAGDPGPRQRHHEWAAAIYDADEREAREKAFAELAMHEVAELELMAPIAEALAERPVLSDATETVLVGEADGQAGEGVTADPGRRLIGLRVRSDRFDDLGALGTWARHTLGHAEDTFDPAFGFDPTWEDAVDGAAAARLHLFWDVSVDGRSSRADRPVAGASMAGYRAALDAMLPPSLAAIAGEVAERLWDGPRPAFADLRRWATRPETLSNAPPVEAPGEPAGEPAPAVWRPGRCPLCAFPTPVMATADAEVALRVGVDFPAWQPETGICPRCLDRYRLTARLSGGGGA